MTPDFPSIKEKLHKILLQRWKNVVYAQTSPFSHNRRMIHEGGESKRDVIIREDGSIEETKFAESRGEFEVKFAEVEFLTFDKVIEKIDAAASKMAEMQSRKMYESIAEATDRVGNVLDGKGRPFSAEMVLEMFDKVMLDFDEKGELHNFAIVIPPAMSKKVKEELEKIEEDPVLKKRFDEIITRKKDEWRVRESNRKLVG